MCSATYTARVRLVPRYLGFSRGALRLRLICADYSFQAGRAAVLPEPPWHWLDALSRDLGTLRRDEIEWTGPRPRAGRFWLILSDALVRRRSDGRRFAFGSLPFPEPVTITEADAARGGTEVAVAFGPSFKVTQTDRHGRAVPYSDVSYAPTLFPREIAGDESSIAATSIRTDADGSFRICRPELFRLIPRPGCTLTIEPDP